MKQEARKQLGINLKAERVRAGLTQEETAERLGITKRQYINYEQGSRVDSINLFQLSKIFNCNINAFYLKVNSTFSRDE